jgi:elongation factor Tu
MPIENALTISGRGTVVTGAVAQGSLTVGETVEVVGLRETLSTVVTGLEMFGRTLERAEAGDNAAVLLRGVRRNQVRRGQVVAAPGTITAHRRFSATLHALPASEGGRHTPFGINYRPQFYVRTTDVPGSIDLITIDGEPVLQVQPGDTVDVEVSLGAAIAMAPGLAFTVREGNRTVGVGQVTAVLT